MRRFSSCILRHRAEPLPECEGHPLMLSYPLDFAHENREKQPKIKKYSVEKLNHKL
jgi:hypothetical protein